VVLVHPTDHFHRAGRRFAIVASRVSPTNRRLLEAARRLGAAASLVDPADATNRIGPGDIALGRLDVRQSLDGVEPGLGALRELERAGTRVLNGPGALLAAHDKLTTALRLGLAALPHPRTVHLDGRGRPDLPLPVVVKPRFGSWGRDVVVCRSRLALRRTLRMLRNRPWFQRQGALVQELVPPIGWDLRIVVAGGEVVGAVERRAVGGEWRTNVALGARRVPVDPPLEARLLAIAATHAVGTDLAGVDLLPDGAGGFVVLEVNGAVDLTEEYGLSGEGVFERMIQALLVSGYARCDEEEAQAAVPGPAWARA
jgi:[lysine-biosynthesis-protein LysW]--L-2-aminoadipate ligase